MIILLNVMRNRETQISDIFTTLSKMNSQMLALREDAFGSNTYAPNLKSAKDKFLAQKRQKMEGTRESSLSYASDDEFSQSNGYIPTISRQDSLADNPNVDNEITETSQKKPDISEDVREVNASDDEECIICDEEKHAKM